MSVINTGTNAVVATIAVGSMPYSVQDHTRRNSRLRCGSGLGQCGGHQHADEQSVVATAPGATGYAVEFTPDSARAYVNRGGMRRSFNIATNTVIGTIFLDYGEHRASAVDRDDARSNSHRLIERQSGVRGRESGCDRRSQRLGQFSTRAIHR